MDLDSPDAPLMLPGCFLKHVDFWECH
uniref:Uncharacterized protein n=1 Tax=Anguilla anguilla TaxID=7936 RepID=A0A0E9TVX6_ANGAN